MAVKISRQPKSVVLIGAPTSAGAHAVGCEAAPAALRRAGIAARLQQIGFDISEGGDIHTNIFRPDDESPRARNARPVVKSLEALQPLAEKAVKSGGLPVILGGDCTITLAVLAAIRRYHKDVSLIYCDGDADLNTPATTPSGYFDGMVVAHIAGQGAAELVRFFKEPPLVREPDIALFGLSRTDPGEQEWLDRSPMRRFTPEEIREIGAADAAQAALDRIHIFNRQWVLHFDVDVLSSDDFPASEFGTPGGLRFDEARAALEVFLQHANLAAVVITEYVPSKDPDGAAAARLLDLFAAAMKTRYAKQVAGEESKDTEEAKEVKEEKEAKEVMAAEEVKEQAASESAVEPSAPAAAEATGEVEAEASAETNTEAEAEAGSGEQVSETA